MYEFKKGDVVQMGLERDKFVRLANENSSTRQYIEHFANGGTATVVTFDADSLQLKADEIRDRSNWFRAYWFQLADLKLNQIKQESQRV